MPLTNIAPPRARIFSGVDTADGEETFSLSDPLEVEGQELVYMKMDASVNPAHFAINGTVVATLYRRGEVVTLYATGGAWFGTQPSRDDVIPTIFDATGTAVTRFQSGGESPVNTLVFKSGTTGQPATITVEGDDTDIAINLLPKGAGGISIDGDPIVARDGPRIPPNTSGILDAPTKAVIDQMILDMTAANVYGS